MLKKVEDEALMVDYLLGQMEEDAAGQMRQRIEGDAELKRLRQDVANTLWALQLMPPVEPPENLVAGTLARIRQDQQIKALIARQEAGRRPVAATFSLRDLGAVAAAVVLLAIVFVPAMHQARQVNLRGECAAQAGQIGTAMLAFAGANHGDLPAAGAQDRWMAVDNTPAASNSAALFKLVQQGYATPPLFQCPAVGGGSFVAQAGMFDFPASRYVSYSYQHTLGGQALRCDDPRRQCKDEEMVILADSTPLFPDGRFHADRLEAAASDNHGGDGQNVLYMDGHVAWATRPTVGVAGDNIFLAGNIRRYIGQESPVSPTDSFLLPAYSGTQRP